MFLDGVYTYYLTTPKIVLSPIQKLFNITPHLKINDNLRIGNHSFRLVENINDVVIPNDGFWFKGYKDLDFIRDASFLEQRFINNKVFSYSLYSTQNGDVPCYFVIRSTSYRGIPALTLCDYRYTPDHPDMASMIIKAVKRIASGCNFGVVFFVSGDANMQKALRHTMFVSRPVDFVTNVKLKKDASFIITGADSDCDFLK